MEPAASRLRVGTIAFVGALFPAPSHAEDGEESPSASLGVTYSGDVVAVPDGPDPGAAYMDNLDVTVTVDLERLVGWTGADAFFYGLANQGGSASSMAGDLQGVDNIEGPSNYSLYEAWLEQRFLGSASLLVGLYDINAEFDHLHSANLFIQSSQGLNAVLGNSGVGGPSSFPVTSLAARLKLVPIRNLYLQAAVLDGVPGDPSNQRGTRVRFEDGDGVLTLFETGLIHGFRGGELAEAQGQHVRRRRAGRSGVHLYRFKLAYGQWWYSARTSDLDSTPDRPSAGRSNYGAYLGADGIVYRESEESDEGLALHARLAYGNPRFNVMSAYTGAGLVYVGPAPGRDSDEAGIAVSTAWASPRHRAARRRDGRRTKPAEVVFEATYSAAITSWFSVQLDAQYVLWPSLDPTNPDAVVLITRAQLAY